MKYFSSIVLFVITVILNPVKAHAIIPYKSLSLPEKFFAAILSGLILGFIHLIFFMLKGKVAQSSRAQNKTILNRNDPIKFKQQHLEYVEELSKFLIEQCKTQDHDPLRMLATADAFEDTVFRSASFKYLDSNVERAEVKLEYFLPLIESAHEAGKEEQALALRLLVLKRLGADYSEAEALYNTWLAECLPAFSSLEDIRRSEPYIRARDAAMKEFQPV